MILWIFKSGLGVYLGYLMEVLSGGFYLLLNVLAYACGVGVWYVPLPKWVARLLALHLSGLSSLPLYIMICIRMMSA